MSPRPTFTLTAFGTFQGAEIAVLEQDAKDNRLHLALSHPRTVDPADPTRPIIWPTLQLRFVFFDLRSLVSPALSAFRGQTVSALRITGTTARLAARAGEVLFAFAWKNFQWVWLDDRPAFSLADFGSFHDAGIESLDHDPNRAVLRLVLFGPYAQDGEGEWQQWDDLRVVLTFQGVSGRTGDDLLVFPDHEVAALTLRDGTADLCSTAGTLKFRYARMDHAFTWVGPWQNAERTG